MNFLLIELLYKINHISNRSDIIKNRTLACVILLNYHR